MFCCSVLSGLTLAGRTLAEFFPNRVEAYANARFDLETVRGAERSMRPRLRRLTPISRRGCGGRLSQLHSLWFGSSASRPGAKGSPQ